MVLGPIRVEVHCHGGVAAPQAVLDSLAALGCEPLDWQTWLATNDNQIMRTEAVLALAAARTERTAAILLDQYHGALRAVAQKSSSDWQATIWWLPARWSPNCSIVHSSAVI